MKRVALIDGGELLFRISAGSEIRRWQVFIKKEEQDGYLAEFNYKKDAELYIDGREDLYCKLFTRPVSKRLAVENLETFVRNIIKETEADDYLICFGSKDGLNFRDDVATIKTYKDRPKDRPSHYDYLKDHVKIKHPYYETNNPFEDDDVLAILHNEFFKIPAMIPIICSHDKDMFQVAGWHFHTDSRELFVVESVQALRNFYKQLLSGDPTDTIPGLYQITGKKNVKIYSEILDDLETEEKMYKHVLYTYQAALNAGDTDDLECILWEIANLLYLRREWDDEGWSIPK